MDLDLRSVQSPFFVQVGYAGMFCKCSSRVSAMRSSSPGSWPETQTIMGADIPDLAVPSISLGTLKTTPGIFSRRMRTSSTIRPVGKSAHKATADEIIPISRKLKKVSLCLIPDQSGTSPCDKCTVGLKNKMTVLAEHPIHFPGRFFCRLQHQVPALVLSSP